MHRDFSWSYEREIETGKQCKAVPTLRNRRIPFTGIRLFHLLGRCPNPRRTQNCVLKRRINPSATRFCKSLYMRQFPSHRLLTPADKAAVDAVLFHQFIVCAALNDSSLVHHKDLICVADGFSSDGRS